MMAPQSSTRPVAEDAALAKQLLDSFEDTWQTGAAPRLEEFWPPPLAGKEPADSATWREYQQDLVKMDLEYRWRRAAAVPETGAGATALGQRLHLEAYIQQLPDLGPAEALSLELIGWEYRVRHCW